MFITHISYERFNSGVLSDRRFFLFPCVFVFAQGPCPNDIAGDNPLEKRGQCSHGVLGGRERRGLSPPPPGSYFRFSLRAFLRVGFGKLAIFSPPRVSVRTEGKEGLMLSRGTGGGGQALRGLFPREPFQGVFLRVRYAVVAGLPNGRLLLDHRFKCVAASSVWPQQCVFSFSEKSLFSRKENHWRTQRGLQTDL